MGTARVLESASTCRKRYELELHLAKAGHKWPSGLKVRRGQPMCGWELVVNIWGWLDGREDPQGRLDDVTPDDLERAAGWDGAEGVLWAALLATKWIQRDGQGFRWHDYSSVNGRTIAERLKKRRQRSDGDDDPPSPDQSRHSSPAMSPSRSRGVSPQASPKSSPRLAAPGLGLLRGSSEDLPPVPTSSVDGPPGGSSRPEGPEEAAEPAETSPTSVAREVRAALRDAEPNLARQPARADGRSRTLETGRTYLARILVADPALHARLTRSGARNPAPGELLREADAPGFAALQGALERSWALVDGDRAAYVRTALADAWAGFLGRLADEAQARRAARRAPQGGGAGAEEPAATAVGCGFPRPTGRAVEAPWRGVEST